MMSINLLLPLAERMLLIWFFAYLFSKTRLFWNVVSTRITYRDKIIFVGVFAAISIMGTYVGIPLSDGAIANIRPIGAIVAGYIGGPLLGSAVGLISGLHRFSLGGFTAFACGVATVFEGLSGGIIGLKFRRNFLDLRGALLAGIIGEVLQVGAVLLLAKPFEKALEVEMALAIPMIVVNTIGVLGFCYIIRDVFVKHNGMIMAQFNRFVEIERKMAQAVSNGLSFQAVEAIFHEIQTRTELKGLFMLKNNALMYSSGNENEIKLAEGIWQYKIKQSPIDCKDTRLLKIKNGMTGASYYCAPLTATLEGNSYCLGVKLMGRGYYDGYVIAFTDCLAELLANQITQINLSKVQDAFDLAQLKALKAQMQPHFLFNALSTISSFCRTNPLKARELILDLAQYFRRTIDVESQIVPLRHELELLTSYLHIEKARFGERLSVEILVDEDHLDLPIPIFSVQPLIENAVKYGIAPLEEGGFVSLKTTLCKDSLTIVVENSRLSCEAEINQGCGKALNNIHERLNRIYGSQATLTLNLNHPAKATALLELPLGGH